MDNVRFFPAMNKLWFVLAFGSCVSGALAQDLQPTPSNRLRSYVREFMASSDVPGMAVAVVRNGEPVHILALGRADLENDISAKDRSVFRWATITRMLTSVSILQLVERGELDLKAPIRKYVPEFRSGDGVTVEHLLANISGVRSINSAEELYNTRRYQRLADTLSIFVDHELLFEPGQRFRSSPFGYNLLGLVIERVSGMSLEDYYRTNIFELAGMSHARLDDATAIIQNRVSGYLRRKDGSLRNSMYADSSLYPASEGAVGSIKDLAAFSAALQANRLVKPAFMQLMTTAYKTTNGKETNYGLGCFVREWEGKRIVGHGGWRRGASSFFLWIPEERLAVCVLANLEQADVKEASLAIARMMLED